LAIQISNKILGINAIRSSIQSSNWPKEDSNQRKESFAPHEILQGQQRTFAQPWFWVDLIGAAAGMKNFT